MDKAKFSRSFADHQEFLPLLRTAVKASKIPGMSSKKAAVFGISSLLGSMEAVKETYGIFPAIPYRISKVRDNLPNAHVLPQRPRNPFNLSHHFFFCKFFPPFSSQASLNMLTVCVAEELKNEEILFAVLHPGWVRTDMGGEEVTKQFCYPHLTRHTQNENKSTTTTTGEGSK